MKTQIRHLANGEKRTVRKADDPFLEILDRGPHRGLNTRRKAGKGRPE